MGFTCRLSSKWTHWMTYIMFSVSICIVHLFFSFFGMPWLISKADICNENVYIWSTCIIHSDHILFVLLWAQVFLIKILNVVCQYFSHFSHLLQNQWAYFYQTRLEASLGQVNILGWPPSKGGGGLGNTPGNKHRADCFKHFLLKQIS